MEFLKEAKATTERVDTSQNLADVFTKSLARPALQKLLTKFMSLDENRAKIEESSK